MSFVATAESVATARPRVLTKTAFYVGLSAFMVGVMLVWLSPVLIGMGYDWRVRGRPHAAYVISAAWLFVGATRILLTESEVWLPVGRAILGIVT